jgi:ribosome-associated protein
VDEVSVGDEGIRLGRLLKLVGLVESGGEAKVVLAEGLVTVNGEEETRRGVRVGPGDVVALEGQEVRLT